MSEWRPIEGAPRTRWDAPIVVGCEGEIDLAYWCDQNGRIEGRWISVRHSAEYQDYVINPTHWLPVEPPEEEGGDQGSGKSAA